MNVASFLSGFESLGVNLDRVRREVIRVLEAGDDSG
jgi:hypothetical protein